MVVRHAVSRDALCHGYLSIVAVVLASCSTQSANAGQQQPAPVAPAPPVAAAPPVAQSQGVTLDGLTLDMDRSAFAVRTSAWAVERQTSRKFANGGEEMRLLLKDQSFVRISWSDSTPKAVVQAIIYNAGNRTLAADLARSLGNQLGKPDWNDGKQGRQVWGGKGSADDGVTPLPGREVVVAQNPGPDGTITVTLARATWYSGRR